jgi:hypothetical protein
MLNSTDSYPQSKVGLDDFTLRPFDIQAKESLVSTGHEIGWAAYQVSKS